MATKKKMLQAAAGVGGNVGAWDLSYAYYDDPFVWDLSSAAYKSNFSVLSQEDNATGIFFKPDGTKMYMIGVNGDDVNEYNLSTAWLVSTASYVRNFSVSAQDTSPNDIFFKSDGTKMYVVGFTGVSVYEYDLSTAWNISTASYLQSFSVSTEESNPQGVFFKPDGLKMYIIGRTGDDVNEYDLSTAWDISSASYLQNFYVGSQDSDPQAVFFKFDGTKMYVVGNQADSVYEYNLSTAWDISAASYVKSFSVASEGTNPRGGFLKPDGSDLYIVCAITDKVYQYSLGGFDVSAQELSPTGVFFDTDGTKMYIIGTGGDEVNEYDLSTAWDISTASFSQLFSVASQDTAPQDFFFKPDGTKMYMVGSAGDDVNEYNLSTAWDISTASYNQNFSVSSQEASPTGLFFKSDGTKMYVVGTNTDNVNEYDLSTAWDISTASYSQNFSVTAQEAVPVSVSFKPDGLKMYIVGSNSDNISEYDLSTAWDVSSAVYLQNFSVASQSGVSSGLFFKPDGTKMFLADRVSDRVFTYTLGPQN